MIDEAGRIWPRAKSRDHPIMFEPADRSWLHWQSILRRQAWLTLLQMRDSRIQKHLDAGPRSRVLTQHHKGDSMRMTNGTLWKVADGLELILGVWNRYTRWHKLDRRIQSRTRWCVEKWEKALAQDIERARRTNDDRSMWHKMRILGRTGRRSRKRNVRDVQREDPSTQEWLDAMSKPGKDGGCLARKVANIQGDDTYNRKTRLHLENQEIQNFIRTFCTPADVLETFMKCVSRGRARK